MPVGTKVLINDDIRGIRVGDDQIRSAITIEVGKDGLGCAGASVGKIVGEPKVELLIWPLPRNVGRNGWSEYEVRPLTVTVIGP